MQKLKLRDVRLIMMIINFAAILFVSLSVAITTEKICSNFQARDFLDTIQALPVQPKAQIPALLHR